MTSFHVILSINTASVCAALLRCVWTPASLLWSSHLSSVTHLANAYATQENFLLNLLYSVECTTDVISTHTHK